MIRLDRRERAVVQAASDTLRTLADMLGMLSAERKPKASQPADPSSLTRFLREATYPDPGRLVTFPDFLDRYREFCALNGLSPLSKKQLPALLPAPYPYGKSNGNRRAVGNISLDQPVEPSCEPRYVISGDRLARIIHRLRNEKASMRV